VLNNWMRSERPYPRLAASISFPQKECWGGPAVLSKYEMIYGNSDAIQVWNFLEQARIEGYGEWADRVIILQQVNIQSPIAVEEKFPRGPPAWWIKAAQYSPDKAVAIAIWQNELLGCDWWLRYTTGSRVPIWTEDRYLGNWSEACPRGLWAGRMTVEGDTIDLGDTRGLTLVEWICTGLRERVIGHPIYRQAYAGIQLQDGPLFGAGPWIPPRTRVAISPAVTITIGEYNESSLSIHITFLCDFIGQLTVGRSARDRMVVRCNGHTLGPYHEGKEHFAHLHSVCQACALEQYGNWGGWPYNGAEDWFALWARIEAIYGPYPRRSALGDILQGWELTTAQCMPSLWWSAERQRQHMRFALGHVLVAGEGGISFSWLEDQTGVRYASGNNAINRWPHIPEADFQLGAWSGPPAQEHVIDGKVIYYRHFRDGEKRYSVAVNLWDRELGGIPAKDAVWFRGEYPGPVERIEFPADDPRSDWF